MEVVEWVEKVVVMRCWFEELKIQAPKGEMRLDEINNTLLTLPVWLQCKYCTFSLTSLIPSENHLLLDPIQMGSIKEASNQVKVGCRREVEQSSRLQFD